MKKYILIILLVFSVKVSSSQNYIPIPMDSAAWLINWICSHCANCSSESITSTDGDTIINSYAYTKIKRTTGYINGGCVGCGACDYPQPGYLGALRQDTLGRKIFIVLPDSTTENLVYDFSKNIGDTFISVLSNNNPVIIIGIDTILVGNQYHKRFNIGTSHIIEGIGSELGLLESFIWFEITTSLICVTHNNQTIYPYTTMNCPTIVGINELIKGDGLKVMPNPFKDQFTIITVDNIKIEEIKMYDIFGRLVLNEMVDQNIIQRNNFPSGIYFYQIISENRIISTGKIIAE